MLLELCRRHFIVTGLSGGAVSSSVNTSMAVNGRSFCHVVVNIRAKALESLDADTQLCHFYCRCKAFRKIIGIISFICFTGFAKETRIWEHRSVLSSWLHSICVGFMEHVRD